MKVMVYGDNATGKTSFASTFPGPILFLSFEDGQKSVPKRQDIVIVPIASVADVLEYADLIAKGKPDPVHGYVYRTVVFDTFSSFQDLAHAEVLGLDEIPVQKVTKSYGKAEQEQYTARGEQVKMAGRAFTKLPSINVVMLVQERDQKKEFLKKKAKEDDKPPESFMDGNLSEAVLRWVRDHAQVIVQTYVQDVDVFREVKNPDPKVPPTRVKTGRKTQFFLRVGKSMTATHRLKVQTERELVLPESIEDPTYEKLAQVLKDM